MRKYTSTWLIVTPLVGRPWLDALGCQAQYMKHSHKRAILEVLSNYRLGHYVDVYMLRKNFYRHVLVRLCYDLLCCCRLLLLCCAYACMVVEKLVL